MARMGALSPLARGAALAALAALACARVTTQSFDAEQRSIILIDRPFGLLPDGVIEIEVWDTKVFNSEGADPANKGRMGFFITTSEDEPALEHDLQEEGGCVLDNENVDRLFTFTEVEKGKGEDGRFKYINSIAPDKGGEYSLFFANCNTEAAVSFDIRVTMYNQGIDGAHDFLPAGEAPLPTLYIIMFVMYVTLSVMWTVVLYKCYMYVKKIHYGMLALLVFKALTVLSQAGEKHLIRTKGDPEGWDIAFYIFTFVRGVFLFSLIVLIGTGWSYIKPFLQEREKKVLAIVIPLQVFANIATIILDESGPSAAGWFTWRDLFHLVDIICCCAVLFPIVWSIKHYREAATADGKAARNIQKLTLFRQFYVMVVSYIYFTRIVVYLLRSTMQYQYVWLSTAASELATLLFYCVTGFMFRPQEENPYLHLEMDELELEELDLIEREQLSDLQGGGSSAGPIGGKGN